jgi:hypothetical protein
MSHKGKLKRGERFWNWRDQDGNIPEWIKKSESRMADLNYFLEDKKNKEEAVEETKPKGKK